MSICMIGWIKMDKENNGWYLDSLTMLQIVFIILKLTRLVSWSWFVTLLPIIISAFAYIVIVIFVLSLWGDQ